MEIKLLTDKFKLPEIYLLRVAAYEKSLYSKYVNDQTYPYGYFDDLDTLDSTLHWIIEDNQQIVGSVRVAIIDDIQLIKEDITKLNFSAEIPFAYCGRTAVHPHYRKTNAMRRLDNAVIQFLKESSLIRFGFCYVTPQRAAAVKRLGFRSVGMCNYNWGNGNETILEAFVWENPSNS